MITEYWHEFSGMQDTHDKHEIQDHTELQVNQDLAETNSSQYRTSLSPSYHSSTKL